MTATKSTERISVSQQEIARRIMHLFSTSDEAVAAERELEAWISSLARSFLNAAHTNTPVGLDDLKSLFQESAIPHDPVDMREYLDYLSANVVEHSTHTASPRFMGHMTTALPYFVHPLGKLLTAMNQNVVKVETAKTLTLQERQTVAMIHRLVYGITDGFYAEHIQNPESTLGMLVSGGTVANTTALWCARNALLRPKGKFKGVEVAGLASALRCYGYEGANIIGSSLIHYSFEKAADLLGIGAENLIKVPTDSRGRIHLKALQKTISKCRANNRAIIALVGVAGATDCGAIDPLAELAEIAREAGIHFHIDAAWGGPVLFSKRHKDKLQGIEQADSVTIDGHKQFYLPMGVGMLLLRNPQAAKLIERQAAYIVRPGSSDLGRRSLEGSRPAMALLLNAALCLIGSKGYEFLIDEGIRKAEYMAASISARPEFELLLEPEINIVTYRYIPETWRGAKNLTRRENQAINEFNVRLQKAQRKSGRSFVSRTTLKLAPNAEATVALRAVLANPLTTEALIDRTLDDQIQIGSAMT